MIFRLSLSQMVNNAIYQFTSLFINLYLFKVNHSIQTVAIFNISLFFFWAIFFYLGFRVCEKNTRIGQALSGIMSAFGVLLLLLHINNPIALGLFTGATGGFFWTSYLSIYRSLGKNTENAGMYARVSLLANVITIFIPILFGYLVSGSGYYFGFIVLFGLSLFMILISFFMPKIKTEKIVITKKSLNNRSYISASILQGFYYCFSGIAAGLLVYMAGQGEASVGSFATYYGLVAVVVTFILAYVLPNRFKFSYMIIASILYILSSMLFFNHWSYSVIIFNFILSVANPLFNNPSMGFNFVYINKFFPNGEEGLLIREWSLCVGRVLFSFYMLFFGLNVKSISFYIMLITLSLFPTFIMMMMGTWRKYEKERAL